MEEKIQRLRSWSKDRTLGPFRIEIHPTNRCNLRCRMCGTRAAWRDEEKELETIIKENKERELSDERLLELIDEAVEMDVEKILLTGGGEPFIRKGLTLKMMEKIKSSQIFGNLNTNGTLLTDEDVKKIVEMGWDLMMFSIDSPNAKVHDFLRNKQGTFEEASKNLIRFKKYKEKTGVEKPEIVFNTVLTDKNYTQLPELVEFAERVDCNDMTLIPLIEPEKYPQLKIQNRKKLIEKLDEAQNIADRYTLHNNIDQVKNRYSSSKEGDPGTGENSQPSNFSEISCFEPFLNMVIKMDGEVTPCCMIEDSTANLKENDLQEIWRGDYYRNLRKDFKEGKIPEICSTCILQKENRNVELKEELRNAI